MRKILLILLLAPALAAEEPLEICATTPDLASLAREIGGEHVQVTTFTRGPEDPHFVEAKPSFIRALYGADLLLYVGLDLEIGWLPVLVRNSRNSKVQLGERGHVNLSAAITPKEIPRGPVDRSMGDVHPSGNPHYLLDPLNGKLVAKRIRDVLIAVRPAGRAAFERAYGSFAQRIDERLQAWTRALAPHRGARVATDHKAWSYFLDRFGLEAVGTLEPKPGMRPTSRHLAGLIDKMKNEKVRVILTVPYFNRRHAEFVASKTGAKVLRLAHQTGAVEGADEYVKMIDHNVRAVAAALKR